MTTWNLTPDTPTRTREPITSRDANAASNLASFALAVLDKEGGWEFAVTIRRNGRRVAVADCLADTYEGGIWTVSTILQCRDVTFTGAAAREMSHEATP